MTPENSITLLIIAIKWEAGGLYAKSDGFNKFFLLSNNFSKRLRLFIE